MVRIDDSTVEKNMQKSNKRKQRGTIESDGIFDMQFAFAYAEDIGR